MNCAQVREWRDGLLVAEPDEPLPTELAEHVKELRARNQQAPSPLTRPIAGAPIRRDVRFR